MAHPIDMGARQLWTTLCCLIAVSSWIKSASCDLTLAELNAVVDAHNTLRRGEGASDMQLLKWNPTLAFIAQDWADRCVWAHGQGINSSSLSSIGLGQNLYASTAPTTNLSAGVQAWFDEKSFYNYDSNTCARGKVCGHYTQVVWATSNEIGCAYKRCPTLSQSGLNDATFLVCNYGPPGNWVGEKPFKKGSSCSACPSGRSYCKNGLCDTTTSAPSMPTIKGVTALAPTTPQPTAASGVTGVNNAVLNYHNNLRQQVQTTPKLPSLTWNANVAALAQAWADTCTFGFDPNLNNLGQNMYISGDSRVTSQQQCDFTAGVKAWYDEVQFYNDATNTCQSGKVCGHYTQVVWRRTTQLGCGYKFCNQWCILVCNYSPPGNYIGQRPY